MVCFPSTLWGRPIRSPAYSHRPPCCIWQSFKTSAGMSVCELCPWQQANRGCHERAGQQRRRKENSNERKSVMEGTARETICDQMRVGVSEFQKRSFVWQMVSWDCWECWDWVFYRLSSLDIPDWLRLVLSIWPFISEVTALIPLLSSQL